jgi:predicted metal-dependent hydrolase
MSLQDKGASAPCNKLETKGLDPRYLAYFRCFNEQRFYEAHDVLEALWLPARNEPDGPFYKGLIQLAAAFVHLQRNRLLPATALLKRSGELLSLYSSPHLGLDVAAATHLIREWLNMLDRMAPDCNPLTPARIPRLEEPPTS